jgi:penicillin-binding protein 1A
VIYLLGLVGFASVAGVGAVVASTDLPEIDSLAQSTFVCTADVGERCGPQNAMAKIQGGEDRVNVTYDKLPQVLIDAVVSVEDRDFFEHRGIDPVGIGRALYRDLRGQGLQQGGSTITQQYVKQVFLRSDRTVSRKLKEAALSIKLEQEMPKQEILEGYLNTVYFGRGAYGVQAASQAYFGKNVGQLQLGEAAYLAGLVRAPNLADATENPEEAKRRRDTALGAMWDEGYITEDEFTFVSAAPLEAREPTKPRTFATTKGKKVGTDYVTAYVDWLLRNEHGFTEEQITGGGLRVYTSLDLEMQKMAWEAVKTTLDQPEDPAAALVALDNQGLVRAMVGGPGWVPGKDERNFAVRTDTIDGRGVGSVYKAVALAEAIRQGISLDSRFNAPSQIKIADDVNPCQPWEPRNYGESDAGVLTLVEATQQSSNTAYAQLAAELGPDGFNALALDLGLEDRGERNPQGCLPDVLGPNNATPLEMATVFSTFANRGVRKDPAIITRIEQVDQDGNVNTLFEWQPDEQRVLTEQQADLVNHTLQQVIQGGTGTAANIGRPAAGKTGTTTENKDAWFVGHVPKMTAAVWMGYPDTWENPETGERELISMNASGKPVHGRAVTGGSFPAEIWQRFMAAVTEAKGWNDAFAEVPPEALREGRVINSDLLTSREQATTTTQPPTTLPPTTQPPGPPRPEPRPRPTLPTVTTTIPDDTVPTLPPTSDPTICLPGDPCPPQGGGGGGGD